ncbi:unnamed protein product, partial [marine sediment metagenome]
VLIKIAIITAIAIKNIYSKKEESKLFFFITL